MLVRTETMSDIEAVRDLVGTAFQDVVYASGREAQIVDTLRACHVLTLSLVAVEAASIVGHVAFSPVEIAGAPSRWFGLGPLAVRRDCRRRGHGGALVEAGLVALAARGAGGCVVLGDPAYYARFGFRPDAGLTLAGVPAKLFQRLCFRDEPPRGEVRYHPVFGGT